MCVEETKNYCLSERKTKRLKELGYNIKDGDKLHFNDLWNMLPNEIIKDRVVYMKCLLPNCLCYYPFFERKRQFINMVSFEDSNLIDALFKQLVNFATHKEEEQ